MIDISIDKPIWVMPWQTDRRPCLSGAIGRRRVNHVGYKVYVCSNNVTMLMGGVCRHTKHDNISVVYSTARQVLNYYHSLTKRVHCLLARLHIGDYLLVYEK